ncbi:hypothetical protein [Streptomyces sp. 8L]|uniref:hypothetical protein n=1 Tax=Streptomyces sp. 8L TaxID=2877242 RepID=UPI001CD482DF|nr:hypothetical protein [Streptomyces sp. 8L]MCA1224236.1 hypothetical protein [Streptomyces sp. 8L]
MAARHGRGRWAALAGALALCAVVTGCGSGGSDSKVAAAPSTTAVSRAPADPDAAQKAAVLAAYRSMTDAEARTYATAKLDPGLSRYAVDHALTDIKLTLYAQQQAGTVQKGSVTRSPKVTAIDTADDPMKATVTDCADSTHYNEVDAKTGKATPYNGSRRHVVTVTAMRPKSGTWRFFTYTIDRQRTC